MYGTFGVNGQDKKLSRRIHDMAMPPYKSLTKKTCFLIF